MTEWVEQRICIKFCIKLEHSSVETIGMIQKAAAMSYWGLAASSRQYTHSCITSHAEFFAKTSNHPGDLVPLQLRFGVLWLLAFPKTKITFERKEISEHRWDSGKYDGTTDGNSMKDFAGCFEQWKRHWENCVRSRGAYFEGDWGVIVLCTMLLVSCIFFNKCLFFILHG